jgi:hypothetical protein
MCYHSPRSNLSKGTIMRLWHWIVGMFRGKAANGTAPETPIAATNEQRRGHLREEVDHRLRVIVDGRVHPHAIQ